MVAPLDWQKDAACRGMNIGLFFPDLGWVIEPAVASVCQRCPVRDNCLQWAIDNDEVGVWGGLTHEQRRSLGWKRGRVKCPDCRSIQIFDDGTSEVCLNCGLSWRC